MTTSPIGMQRNGDNARVAFTLVELILVMAIMITLLALAVPTLLSSFRQHNLDQEAARLLALTEYGRDEAVSQGMPMMVWINPTTGHYGVKEKTGYSGSETRRKEFCLNPDIHFNLTQATATAQGVVNAVELTPDGSPDPASISKMGLLDRFNAAVSVSQTADGWGYEIVKGAR